MRISKLEAREQPVVKITLSEEEARKLRRFLDNGPDLVDYALEHGLIAGLTQETKAAWYRFQCEIWEKLEARGY